MHLVTSRACQERGGGGRGRVCNCLEQANPPAILKNNMGRILVSCSCILDKVSANHIHKHIVYNIIYRLYRISRAFSVYYMATRRASLLSIRTQLK